MSTFIQRALLALAASVLFFHCAGAIAQPRESNSQALKDIRETSEAICKEVPLKGKTESVELTGQAKAELVALAKRLGAAGISGAARYASGEYANVLQKDLAPLMQGAQDCRLRVFEKLSDLLLQSPAQEAPTQAHPKKPVTVGGLSYTFDDIVVRSGSRPGRYETTATFTLTNVGKEPVEVAIHANYSWPTLVLSGATLKSYNPTIALPFVINVTPVQCASRTWQFQSLQPGEPHSTSIGFAADLAPGSLKSVRTATLVGQLALRTKKSTECETVAIPGRGIPASVAP